MVKFEMEILKLFCRSSRPPNDAEFGHFTLLFYRGRQRNVPCNARAQLLLCSLNLLFSDVPVAVVVFLDFLMSVCKKPQFFKFLECYNFS